MGFSPASVPEGFQRASGKPFGAPVGAYPFPRRGLTRRLRRGRWVCRPEEGSTFFRRERKYQRKHAARRLREKALYCPFLKEGVRNVARNIVGELTHAIVRARAHSYPLSKRARLFPSAAYRRSAPPPLGWGEGQIVRVGIIRCSMADFAGQKVDGVSTFCWPLERAGGPVARRRSVQANKQETTPDRRAVAPVVPRR